MASYNNDKIRIMQDEMNRFEEEIGLPNPPLVGRSMVIGTSTFSQAEKVIHDQNSDESVYPPNLIAPQGTLSMTPSVFIPPQVLHRAQGPSSDQVIPPPPMPPLMAPSVPGSSHFIPQAGMQFPSMMSYPPGMPPFGPPMMAPPPHPGARFSTPSVRPHFNKQNGSKTSSNSGSPKTPKPVVLSATPQLYNRKPDADSSKEQTKLTQPEEASSSANNINKSAKKKPISGKDGTEQVAKPSPVDGAPQTSKKKEKKQKKIIRVSGGTTWEDPSLTEWEEGDFRLFCGDLGNDVTDELLIRVFSKYPSFLKARVVRDKRTNKTKGFGFVSFKDPQDFIRATKEMNGRYVGSRPIKLRKSTWRNRNIDVVKKKEKEKAALIAMLTGK